MKNNTITMKVMNQKFSLAVLVYIAVALIACDDYVHFEVPPPPNAGVITTVPEALHGVYNDTRNPNISYSINEEGIYKYNAVRIA